MLKPLNIKILKLKSVLTLNFTHNDIIKKEQKVVNDFKIN